MIILFSKWFMLASTLCVLAVIWDKKTGNRNLHTMWHYPVVFQNSAYCRLLFLVGTVLCIATATSEQTGEFDFRLLMMRLFILSFITWLTNICTTLMIAGKELYFRWHIFGK